MRQILALSVLSLALIVGCSSGGGTNKTEPVNPNYDSPGKANPTDRPNTRTGAGIRPLGVS